MLNECYIDAKDLAATETELPWETFPNDCPFSIDQILNSDFLPEPEKMNPTSKTNLNLYKTDFVAWTEQTAKLINAKKFSQVDWQAVVQEIESLGKADRRELKSRLEVLLQHLLKWQYQSNLQSSSWQSSIYEQRKRILDLLKDSPSLQPYLTEVLPESYHRGKKAASDEIKLQINAFPADCPYSIDQILDSEFLPRVIS